MTHRVDFILFALYLVLNIALGIWVARRRTAGTRDYFLAGDGLPWYAIGGSIIAANISTEHFIGMIGVAYAVGFVVAQWEWGNWFTFSALIWIFLPVLHPGRALHDAGVSRTALQFHLPLPVRGLFARAVDRRPDGRGHAGRRQGDERHVRLDETVTIIGLAVLAGSYTIYGGLVSVAWTDFLQFVVMMLGGLIVTVVGLHKVGGLHDLMTGRAGEVQDHLPDHGQGVSLVRRLEFVSLDRHLVQLHEPVHRAALPGRPQRMGRADGRGVCRVHEDPAAAAGGHPGHRGLPAVPEPAGQGPGVPDARARIGADRA